MKPALSEKAAASSDVQQVDFGLGRKFPEVQWLPPLLDQHKKQGVLKEKRGETLPAPR